jgi:hypothetical protein
MVDGDPAFLAHTYGVTPMTESTNWGQVYKVEPWHESDMVTFAWADSVGPVRLGVPDDVRFVAANHEVIVRLSTSAWIPPVEPMRDVLISTG